MFKVWSNKEKNRLYITLKGTIGTREAHDAVATVLREARQLMPGFDIINDLSGFIIGSPSGLKQLFKCMRELRNIGVGRVVRVLGNSKLGLLQFVRVNKEASAYKAEFARNLKAAEEFLDKELVQS